MWSLWLDDRNDSAGTRKGTDIATGVQRKLISCLVMAGTRYSFLINFSVPLYLRLVGIDAYGSWLASGNVVTLLECSGHGV